jgi:hypothetical protein
VGSGVVGGRGRRGLEEVVKGVGGGDVGVQMEGGLDMCVLSVV